MNIETGVCVSDLVHLDACDKDCGYLLDRKRVRLKILLRAKFNDNVIMACDDS